MKTIIIDGIEYNLTPKVLFKKGDFVVIQETTYLISKIEGINVTLFCNGRECLFDIDVLKNARLWDVSKDAKDGDVLAVEPRKDYPSPFIAIYKERGLNFFNSHCFVSWDGEFHEGTTGHSISDIHPATKEQCDQLERAMTNAGYKWNKEELKLEKI